MREVRENRDVAVGGNGNGEDSDDDSEGWVGVVLVPVPVPMFAIVRRSVSWVVSALDMGVANAGMLEWNASMSGARRDRVFALLSSLSVSWVVAIGHVDG